VVTAESGEDALAKVGGAHPAMVISDTQLPGMDGYEFCKQLKQDSRWDRLPFIFLTQQEGIEEKIRGLELGVEEYLTKPIFIKELLIRIKMVLQKKEREIFTDKEGQTTFKGTLADMAVVDLIQTMELGQKSGLAQFSRDDGLGATLYFSGGKIIDAVEGETRGADAVYALLGWANGSFVVEFQSVERAESITESNQGLLMEGLRRVDEWNRIRMLLPDQGIALEQDPAAADAVRGELDAAQSMVLALTDGVRSVEDINGALAMDDLEILSAVRQLLEMGVLFDPAEDVPPGDPPPPPDTLSGVGDSPIVPSDLPQPAAFGSERGGRGDGSMPSLMPPGKEVTNPGHAEPATVGPEMSAEAQEAERGDWDEPIVRSNTQPFGQAIQAPGEADQNLVDVPPEEMEEDGEEPPFYPDEADLPPIPEDAEGELPPIPEDADDELPPIPEDADDELPPIPEDADDEQPPMAEDAEAELPPMADELAADAPLAAQDERHGLDVDEAAETARFQALPDEDEEADAIEDEEPPPQITAALTDSTEELTDQVSLIRQDEVADDGEPVYLLQQPDEGDEQEAEDSAQAAADRVAEMMSGQEPDPEEEPEADAHDDETSSQEAAADADDADDEPAEKLSRKQKKKKRRKGKKGKKGKKERASEPTTGNLIPFPGSPRDERQAPTVDMPSGGSAEPAPRVSIAEAAEEAALLSGAEDPSEVSINVRDEEFFNSDYTGDDLSAFDESLIVPAGPPPKWRLPALIVAGVALIGASITTYYLVTSPYIGDGPAHLRVDPASLAKQEAERRKAEEARRQADEKEQQAFLDGKHKGGGAPAASAAAAPAPKPSPAAATPAAAAAAAGAPAPAAPAPATPEAAKPAPTAAAPATPEPAKPAPAPAAKPPAPAPAAAPAAPAAGGEYATLLAEAKALMKKRKKRNAIKKFKAAIKANPEGWEAMEQVALYNMELGRMGTAYKLAKKVAALNPEAPYAHLVIGGMLQERGNRSGARRAYSKFLRLCPKCRYARDIRAVMKSM